MTASQCDVWKLLKNCIKFGKLLLRKNFQVITMALTCLSTAHIMEHVFPHFSLRFTVSSPRYLKGLILII